MDPQTTIFALSIMVVVLDRCRLRRFGWEAPLGTVQGSGSSTGACAAPV